jgi:hypothetical protein
MIAPIWAPLFHADKYWYEGVRWSNLRYSASWSLARDMSRSWDRSWDASNGYAHVGAFVL